MNSQENVEFTAYLKEAVRVVEKEGYKPQRFKSMIDADGGFATVKRILESGKPSEGFVRLLEMGRLAYSCEAIIVESKWRRHFDDDLLARSEKLLRTSGYSFKRFEEASQSQQIEPGKESQTASQSGNHLSLSGTQRDTPEPSAPGRGINAFFESVLFAPTANSRWSWGAADHRTRRVFLRLWSHDIDRSESPRLVRIIDGNGPSRPGKTERERHVELIKAGYGAYAVMCEKDGPEGKSILAYDANSVYPLDAITIRDGSTYMALGGNVPVAQLPMPTEHPAQLGADLEDMADPVLRPTTRKALVDARLGQGRFRRELMRRWSGACAVTGCTIDALLRASHCKPWRKSSHLERLDSHNGLLLSANLDALFDSGLISFDNEGNMLVASSISNDELKQLQIPRKLSRTPGPELSAYLGFHRESVFLDKR